MTRMGEVSFWYADIGLPSHPRPPLTADAQADVAIIGAGYTGLWTAYYLKQARPDLRVVVLEKHFAGYGASGRNGGWLTGSFAWNHETYARDRGRDSVLAMVEAMNGTVDEVIRVAEAEGIDADIRRTEELLLATNAPQLARVQEEVAHRQAWGEDGRVRLIGAGETRARLDVPGALGAMVVSGVARIQPAKLARGLAEAVERHGVVIHEGTEVTGITRGQVTTARGIVRAPVILRCTEGFTATLPGLKRDWLPMNSAQIVTEPLPQSVWDRIGWDGHEIMAVASHTICYCQRTREGRIAVGGRGIPYRWGSAIDADGAPDPVTVDHLREILRRYFPAAAGARIDHAWCGVLAVPRDWCAAVGYQDGIGFAGGYVGVGVSTTNLAGRTLADLALGRRTGLTALPWVNRQVRKWEPEPLRWLAIRGMFRLMAAADRAETRTGRPSRLSDMVDWLGGR